MIKVNVLVSNRSWKKYIKDPKIYLKKKIKKIEQRIISFKKNTFVFSLLLSDNKNIQQLNKKFRNKNLPTDVLSFPFQEKNFLKNLLKKKSDIYLGDVIISLDKVAPRRGKNNFKIAFDKIWVHGFTHLLGYRHKSDSDYLKMRKFEKNILKAINFNDRKNSK
jgi:probable rRNA maturation factor